MCALTDHLFKFIKSLLGQSPNGSHGEPRDAADKSQDRGPSDPGKTSAEPRENTKSRRVA
jgi:hypothetical protein